MKRFLLLVATMSAICLHAQVRGKLVEVSPKKDTTVIPGVTVSWKDGTQAAITDQQGNFTLPTSAGSNELMFQAVGYEKKSIVVKDTSRFMLIALKSGIELNEVDVVYYSSGTEVSYLSAMKIETLNERSLMKAACCNLSESFETNPSIDVNFADAISGTKQIQMLGLSGQYAQITKENMPYMRGLANNYGLTFIPGTWIQSIQLSKGAGSVINGYESFTGQINTELQNPAESDQLHFNSYVNENARNEYNLNLSRRFNPKFSAGLLSHVSFNPMMQDLNNDGFMDIPTGKQYNFMNKYNFNDPKSGFEAQFGGGYLVDERNGGQMPGMMTTHHEPYKIDIDNEKLELYSKTGFVFHKKPGTSMGLQLSYLDHKQSTSYGDLFTRVHTSGVALSPSYYNGRQRTFYANYIFQGIIGTSDNVYKFGASYLHDDVDEFLDTNRFNRLEQVPGAFVEFAKNYKEKFNLVAGLRADYHNYYGFFVTPRLHLRYAFNHDNILRFSGGTALRTANIFTDNSYLMASSRAWNIEGTNDKLPYGLEAERGVNYGLNFTRRFKLNYRESYVTLDVYRTDFQQQVVVDVDQNTQEVNIYNLKGPSYSNTFQFEFSSEVRKRFFVKTAYRYVDTKVQFKKGLMQKAMVSMHRAFVNLSYETKNDHWQFDFTTQYNGEKRLPNTQSNPELYQRAEYSPAYFNLLGQITYLTKIKDFDFNVYLGVENLLNYKQSNPILASDAPYSEYFDASMVWGPVYGRMLYAGLRLKLK